MHGEHPHSYQVGLTHMVDEAADVAVEPGIDAVWLPYLNKTMIQQHHSHMTFLVLNGELLWRVVFSRQRTAKQWTNITLV